MEYESARVMKRGSISKKAPDEQVTQFLHNMLGQVIDAAEERGLDFDFVELVMSVTDKRWLDNNFQTEEYLSPKQKENIRKEEGAYNR